MKKGKKGKVRVLRALSIQGLEVRELAVQFHVQHFSIRHSVQFDYRSHYLLSNGCLEPLSLYTSENKVEQDSLFLYCIWCIFYLQTIFTFIHINYFL